MDIFAFLPTLDKHTHTSTIMLVQLASIVDLIEAWRYSCRRQPGVLWLGRLYVNRHRHYHLSYAFILGVACTGGDG
jgi:hypothetical protein